MSATLTRAHKAILAICAEFGVTHEEIFSKSRRSSICAARNSAMIHLRNNLKLTLEDVARLLNCHHTSVITACNRDKNKPYRDGKTKAIAKAPEPKPISVLPVVATTQDYCVLLGGRRMFVRQRKGDCLVTWSDGKQEFISSQAALKYADLLDWRVK